MGIEFTAFQKKCPDGREWRYRPDTSFDGECELAAESGLKLGQTKDGLVADVPENTDQTGDDDTANDGVFDCCKPALVANEGFKEVFL